MTDAALLAADQMQARALSRRVVDLLAVVGFLAIGLGWVLFPYTTGQAVPGDLGDSRFNLAVLEFFYHSLAAALHGRPASFVNAPFFYPWPRVTNFSDTFWGDGEVYALARALGLDMLAAFRVWFLAGFALTYIATFVSFRKLGLATWGAATGAFLFTFPLPMAAQFDHVQLVYRLWIGPAVVALDYFLRRRSLPAGAACVLFVALQLAASIYLGLFLCLLLVAYAFAVCAVSRGRLAWGRPWPVSSPQLVATAIMLMLGLGLIAIVGIPYFEVQSLYGFTRTWPEVAALLPRPGSYLLTGVSRIWPDLYGVFHYPFVGEQQIFPGLSGIIGAVWFLVVRQSRRRYPLATVMLVSAATIVAVTIKVHGHTMYRPIFFVPGFSSVRAISRVIFVVMLPLATLFGLLIDDLMASESRRIVRFTGALALILFLVSESSLIHHYSSSPAEWRARFEALLARLPHPLPDHAVLAIASPAPQPGAETDWPVILVQTDADLAAASLGIPTLNGYSGNTPPNWKPMMTCGDVIDDFRAGQHFLVTHGLRATPVEVGQIVLLGFGPCDLGRANLSEH